MMKKKTFDCVEMKRREARRIYREIAGMTREQEVEYWRRGTAQFRAVHLENRRESKGK